MELLRQLKTTSIYVPFWGALLLLAYMPFHIFLSQSLSLVTGGLEIWKIGKDLALILFTLFAICLVWKQGKADKTFWALVGAGGLYGLLHLVLWAFNTDIYERSAMLGIMYNMRLSLCIILGYAAVRLLPKFVFSSVLRLIVVVSTVVAGLGVLQYFLPQDLLTHVGYSLERGVRPAFAIDDASGLHRIMSTLREPNALGAYLIVPATLLLVALLNGWKRGLHARTLFSGALLLHLLAIGLTFSRSAWLATALAFGLIIWWRFREGLLKLAKRFWPLLVAAVLSLGITFFAIKDTYFFQHYIVHSDPTEEVQDLDSNDYHLLFMRQGLEGIADQPLGHGPGTAGLASIQNPKGSFLTENYYIQIGYELGVVGALFFIGCLGWIYARLWRIRQASPWITVMLASFWAYAFTNMLLHTWSNEAVAAQWWILAGMVLGMGTMQFSTSHKS